MDLEDFENNTASAKYAEFSISPNAVSAEEDGYTLYVAGFEDGGAGTPCCRPNKGLWGGGGRGEGRAGTTQLAPSPFWAPPSPLGPKGPCWLPPSLGLGPGRSRVPSLQAALRGAAVSLHCRSTATQQRTQGGRPVPPGCHVTPRVASPVPAIPLPASTGPCTPPQWPHPSSPPPGDSLSYHSGQKFSTFDRDQDLFVQNCAALSSGAFWFRSCHFANLNGFYLGGSHLSYANGINWAQWKGFYYSLKRTEMKIRRA